MCIRDRDSLAIYATSEDSTIIALDKRTGNIIWRNSSLFGRGASAPSVIGQYILVFGNAGDMYFYNKNTGNLAGNFNFPGKRVIGSPLISTDPETGNDIFYALSDKGTVYNY